MQLLLPNPSQIVLQAYALEPDGTEKLNVDSGTVRVFHIAAGSEADDLAATALAQVGGTNKWRYVWLTPGLAAGEYVAEFILTDSGGKTTKFGDEIVIKDIAEQSTLVLVQADMTIVKKVETGRWKIVGNQMIFYDDDEVTPLLTFDLKDAGGLPSMTDVFERVPNP